MKGTFAHRDCDCAVHYVAPYVGVRGRRLPQATNVPDITSSAIGDWHVAVHR